MNFIELTLEEALEKQSLGEILILDASPSFLNPLPLEGGREWRENL